MRRGIQSIGLGGEKEGEREGREVLRRCKMGGEGCIREKSMDEEQKKKRIEGWKINLYQKTLPSLPPTHAPYC